MNYQEIELPGPSKVAMNIIYRILWEKLPRKSIISGLWLREYEKTPLFPNCFLYVLNPKEYPYFKYYLRNIVLVTPGEAGLWSQASEEERIQYSLSIEEKSQGRNTADWTVLKRLQAVLIEEYGRVFPTRRGMLINITYSLEQQKVIIGRLNEKFVLSLNKT